MRQKSLEVCLSVLCIVVSDSQAPLSLGFSRPEYWSGLPFPSPGDLPNPGIEPRSLALEVDSLLSESPEKPVCLSVPLNELQKEVVLGIGEGGTHCGGRGGLAS